ncbi:MAG: exo-alpha-sialidase [Alphaproteobacteria bacterium]|nr:exo-alpha-sialidase [Alphaproteobacteria bacterium]
MTLFLLLAVGCKKGEAPPAGLVVDCFQSGSIPPGSDGRFASFTVSGTAPYEWAVGNTRVDPTGLSFETAGVGEGSFTFADGTVHAVLASNGVLFDGDGSVYRLADPLERSDDFGATWVPLAPPLAPSDDAVPSFAVGGPHVLIWSRGLGTDQMVWSKDRGQTWEPVPYPAQDSVLITEVTSAAVGRDGRLLVSRRREDDTSARDVLYSDDAGQSWTELAVDLSLAHVGIATDGAMWVGEYEGLFRSADGEPLEGGPPVTSLHGTDARAEPVLGVDARLLPQSGGRMGFRSTAGVGGVQVASVLPYAYCVAGPDTTGSVVPEVDGSAPGPVRGGLTPGKLDVIETFSSPAVDFTVFDGGRLVTIDVDTSFDATSFTVSLDGQPWLDTWFDRPITSPAGLAPVALATHPSTKNVILATRPTDQSEGRSGEIWEITPDGTLTDSLWVLGELNGEVLFPVGVTPGPGFLMLVATSAGTFDANLTSFIEPLGIAGDVAIDPANGDIFWDDEGWVARSTGGLLGVYADRCTDAVASDQECYDLTGITAPGLAVSLDRFLYAAVGTEVLRRPVDYPEQGWETVADGFSGSARIKLFEVGEETQLWVLDGATLWAGIVGDALPMVR